MNLRLNHELERNAADLKIYSRQAHLKIQRTEKNIFCEIYKSALDSVDVTTFKTQDSIILTL